jgi:acetyltransferase
METVMPIVDQPATPLLPAWAAKTVTRDGLALNVRPACADDEQRVVGFFKQLNPQDLRFRFLSAMKGVSPGLAHALVDIDHTQTENLLAFDPQNQLVATTMIAAPQGADDAEVAVAVRSDLKGHGVGWSMLNQACDYARSRGFKALHSVQMSDDRAAITLEEEMGFRAQPCPDDMSLTILSKDLTAK